MNDVSNDFGQEQQHHRLLRLAEYYESQFMLQTLCARQDALSLDVAEAPMSLAEARRACEYYYNLYEYHL